MSLWWEEVAGTRPPGSPLHTFAYICFLSDESGWRTFTIMLSRSLLASAWKYLEVFYVYLAWVQRLTNI